MLDKANKKQKRQRRRKVNQTLDRAAATDPPSRQSDHSDSLGQPSSERPKYTQHFITLTDTGETDNYGKVHKGYET